MGIVVCDVLDSTPARCAARLMSDLAARWPSDSAHTKGPESQGSDRTSQNAKAQNDKVRTFESIHGM